MSTRKASGPSRSGRCRASPGGAGAKATRAQREADAIEEGRRAYMARDFERARALWLPLAEAGNAEAQAWVGSLHANGDGVEADAAAAFAWYLKSAEGRNVLAQSNVGAMYAMGSGVAQDMAEAVRWLRRAARGGDANARFNLGVLYSQGNGVPRNNARAAEWYRKAAETGHYQSQARLGHMYLAGEGVKRDRVQAFLWLSLAARHGIGSALTALEAVVKEMSSDEKAAGMRLVAQWRGRADGEADVLIDPVPV